MPRALRILAGWLLLGLITYPVAGCGSGHRPPAAGPAGPPTARATARPDPALCQARQGRVVGSVADPALTELSGLTRAAGALWAVEDSGAGPVVVALRPSGTVLGATTVTGATAVDWEDVAAAGAELFVADIGDNAASRSAVQVYRFPAPKPGAAATAPAARLDLTYPDGPHDAEALIADRRRNQLLVLTKSATGARAYIARLDAPAGSTTLLRAGPRVPEALVTGASLSADGRVLAVRNYSSIAVWRREGREPLARTLRRRPCRAPADLLGEGQGEAVALDARGRSALTVAEAAGTPIRRYAAD